MILNDLEYIIPHVSLIRNDMLMISDMLVFRVACYFSIVSYVCVYVCLWLFKSGLPLNVKYIDF